jgi:hypothetical protein
MANLLFHNFGFAQHHLVAQVASQAVIAIRAKVTWVQVELRQFRSASSVSADSFLYHFGVKGSWPYDLCKPFPGVFPSQTAPSDAQDTQLLASSLLGLWCKLS